MPDHTFGGAFYGKANKYNHALLVGKWLPLHAGHEYLINEALRLSGVVTVIVVRHDGEFIPAEQRAYWITQTFTGRPINVKVVDDIHTDDSTQISHRLWAQYVREIVGYSFDVVFTSEEYGKPWADELGVKHVLVDIERKLYPVSGTIVRENPNNHLDMVNPIVKEDIIPRIVVMGSESSGTTTLSNQLADHYLTNVVPEFGRELQEDAIANGDYITDWNDELFWLISRGQDARENRFARSANKLLICDTDSLATYVWYLKYNPKGADKMKAALLLAGLKQAKKHTLYIITDCNIPWEDDGTRDGEADRAWMQVKMLHVLTTYGIPYKLVTGSEEERLAQATAAIDEALNNRQLVAIS